MLPFLKMKQKAVPGVIVEQRKPDEQQDDPSAGAKACMSDLINAIHSRDTQGALDAYTALQDCAPEAESEDASPHSYDAQNQKAAE